MSRLASTPAPKGDRIKGSKRNSPGSASDGRSVVLGDRTEARLKAMVKVHNETAKHKATLSMVKAVYRRGAGAFSTSHRPGMTRAQWAMARVNAFLYLLSNGRPKRPAYTQDNDLLPSGHPKARGG